MVPLPRDGAWGTMGLCHPPATGMGCTAVGHCEEVLAHGIGAWSNMGQWTQEWDTAGQTTNDMCLLHHGTVTHWRGAPWGSATHGTRA